MPSMPCSIYSAMHLFLAFLCEHIEYCFRGQNEVRSITFSDNREQVAKTFGRSGSLAEYTMLIIEVHQPGRLNFEATEDARTIRYSQALISRHFQDGRSVKGTARQLSGREVSAFDIEPIRLFERDGQWHSLDNRRSWAFKTARCPQVPVVYVSVNAKVRREVNRKFTTVDGGLSIQFLD
ncbi:unnamed protein product [Symbiodinium sp. CCMP2456]|nr:unnamed protein product [Symbiodinium sp. CCMP2456]